MSAGGGQGNWGPWPVAPLSNGPVVVPGQIKVTAADPVPDYISSKMESTEHTVALTVDAADPSYQRFNVEVVGIRDTTGAGTTLPIQQVPDSGPSNDTVLVRPGGAANIIGVSGATLRTYKERYLPFCLVNLNPIGNPGYLKTSDPGNLDGTLRNYPLGVKATRVRLMFNVDANDLVTNLGTGVITFEFYINGVLTSSVTALTDVAADTVIDTGYETALGVTAETDKWSVRISSTGNYTSGGISLSGGLIVGYTDIPV